jgi:hypothetical protein
MTFARAAETTAGTRATGWAYPPWVSVSNLSTKSVSVVPASQLFVAAATGVRACFAPFSVDTTTNGPTNSNATEDRVLTQCSQPDASPQAEAAADVREIYGLVKAVFGAPVSDIADAFGVARKTLYAWLGAESLPNLRPAHVNRALCLDRIAHHAADLLDAPIGADAVLKLGGSSFRDLVNAKTPDEDKIRSWLAALADTRSRSYSQRRSVIERLEQQGLVMPPGADAGSPII